MFCTNIFLNTPLENLVYSKFFFKISTSVKQESYGSIKLKICCYWEVFIQLSEGAFLKFLKRTNIRKKFKLSLQFYRASQIEILCYENSETDNSRNLMEQQQLEAVARSCSVKKVLLKISQNSQENTCARNSFLIKLQAYAKL